MSIRVLLCFAFVIWFSYYAWRNVFASLCALVLMMAAMEHPDMPKSIGGIQGANPLNILLGSVFLAWRKHRREQGWSWELPRPLPFLFKAFVVLITWSYIRLAINPTYYLSDYGVLSAFSDYWINNVKWLLVSIMFFDSCRSEAQARLALYCILGLYFLLAVQVIRWMPLSYAMASGQALAKRASKIIQNEIGYNRVTLSMILGGASWATLTVIPLFKRWPARIGLMLAALVMLAGQSLTGGRTGYIAWAGVGLVVSLVRFRALLPLIPIGAAVVLTFMPSVRERVFSGAGKTSGSVQTQGDHSEMTSGRSVIWPYVIDEIKKTPIIGHGRLSMQRIGLSAFLLEYENEPFNHPHNAYLEQLLDNGVVGLMCVLPLLLILLWKALQLLKDRSDPLFTAVGGLASAMLLALLIGSLAGQTFYPRESSVGMWAAIGVMLRISVERFRSMETGLPLFASPEEESDSGMVADAEDPKEITV